MLVDIVVEQGADRVVSRGHRMEIAGEVEVDLLHRQHLGIAATSSTALDAEARTQRGFAKGYCRLLANLVKTQRQTDAHRGLTNTCFRRTDGRHQDQTALLDLLLIDECHRHLGHITSVGFNLLRGNSQLCCDVANGLQFAFPCNLYVSLHNDVICSFRRQRYELFAKKQENRQKKCRISKYQTNRTHHLKQTNAATIPDNTCKKRPCAIIVPLIPDIRSPTYQV